LPLTDAVVDAGNTTHCWSAVAQPSGGVPTRHARSSCDWGPDFRRVLDIGALAARDSGFALASGPGGALAYARVLPLAGPTAEVLRLDAVLPRASGPHVLELLGRGPTVVSTGMHALGLRVRVERVRDDALVAEGSVSAGAHADPAPRGSTALEGVDLQHDEAYRVVVTRPEVASMAGLQRAALYDGPGGAGQPATATHALAGVRLLTMQASAEAPPPTPAFDGADDLDKTPKASRLTPGITLAPWERVSLAWDARWIYGVVVSKGFEDATRAFVFYLQVVPPGASAPPQTGQGMTYLGLTPKLPFTPEFAIGVRSGCDLGDGYGPWCGVFARDAATGAWSQRSRLAPAAALGDAGLWVASDKHTVAFRIPRAALGPAAMAPKPGTTAASLRLAGHLVHGGAGDEWKDVVPAFAMPWMNAATGYYVIDLGEAADASAWQAL
ncbi:MAG: hypothetical protein RIT45_760, partial [Pseudomonadota bacterium]